MIRSVDLVAGEKFSPDLRLGLTRQDFARLVIFTIFIENVLLLTFGSSPLSLFLLTVMETGCYLIFSRYIQSDINSAIVLAIGLCHLIIASFIKILLFQSLDDNLIIPELTEFISLLYFICLMIAFFAARRLPILRFRSHPEPSVRTLEWLVLISGTFMLLPLLTAGSDTDINTNGPINLLGVATRGFPTVAMVASVMRAVKVSECRRIIDPWSGTILGLSVIVGLAGNSREGVLAPVLAAFITSLYCGYRFSFRMIATLAVIGLFVAFILSPAILIVRNERDTLNFPERIEKTIETAGLIVIGDPATTDLAKTPLDFINYSIWGRYFGRPVPFADRIGLIQTTDAMAAAAYGGNYVEIDGTFGDMIAGLFPNFVLNWFDIHLQRNKATTDFVAGKLGLADPEAASFLTIPLDAEAYATGGLWSVIAKSLLAYLLVFYMNRLFIGSQRPSGVLPISLLLLGYHVCSEGDAGAILYYSLRILPQFVVSFSVVYWAARVLGSMPSSGVIESQI